MSSRLVGVDEQLHVGVGVGDLASLTDQSDSVVGRSLRVGFRVSEETAVILPAVEASVLGQAGI
jgi:hypothetical protein